VQFVSGSFRIIITRGRHSNFTDFVLMSYQR